MTLELRPIESADAERLRRFHRRLSEVTVYNRYHAPHPELSDREVRFLVGADGHSHLAWVACDDTGEIHGVCRVVAHKGANDEGEVGIVVDDSTQGSGLGRALLEQVLDEAADHGFRTVNAVILTANVAARGLFVSAARRMGIDWRGTITSGVLDLRLDLATLAAPVSAR